MDLRAASHGEASDLFERTTSPGCASEVVQGRDAAHMRAASHQLKNVLFTEFGPLDALENSEREVARRGCLPRISDVLRHVRTSSSRAEGDGDGGGRTLKVAALIEHRLFTLFFMLLTLYSLFVPDLEVMLGNKDSKVTVSIVTTIVLGLFIVEFALLVWARPQYRLRAYFWLDLIAILSLLPDTYILQVMFAGESLLSGRSVWLLRILRLSRSSKATRLNRLTRIVRVVALMPRLLFVGRKKGTEEVTKLLDKKLERIFAFLDDDMDGLISEKSMAECLATFRAGRLHHRRPSCNARKSPTMSTTCSDKDGASCAGEEGGVFSISVSVGAFRKQLDSCGCQSDSLGGNFVRTTSAGAEEGSDVMVNSDLFRATVQQDTEVHSKLKAACRHQLRRTNDMQNLTSRHSEDVGVKVALGVLLMLLVLTLVEPGIQDFSALLGLEHLDTEVRYRYPNVTGEVPPAVRRHTSFWMRGIGGQDDERVVVYLDLNRQVYCDTFDPSSLPCDVSPDRVRSWSPRTSLKDIDRQLLDSSHRWTDLVPLRLPDLTEMELSEQELERATTAVAVLDAQASVRREATMSIITTILVIFIILFGIILLTKDITQLSTSLLKPLRSLAEEMQSIVQLQLAGLTTNHPNTEKGTAEIRQIQRIFDNMKKAIKSWGKYVPWPVVQLLLHAGVDAKPGVEEREVTLFFSDIASFTSIVENLPPQDSLLLLSRYFNDMSKVIDDHGGIVIEFIGDAILSVYGAPLKNSEHATAAVKSTLRMLASLGRINEWSSSHGLPEVHIRCGVHTGRVLVGNMGFHSRMKYGVVGENANIPGRLEELNKTYSTEMLISHATYSRLDRDAFIVRPIDYIYLRHAADAQSELIYQVMSRDRRTPGRIHRLKPAATLHAKAMELYRAREFARAMELFHQVNETMQETTGVESDVPSSLMMKRCRAYLKRPPPPSWDGVWDQPNEPA